MDVVTVQNFDAFLAKKFFVVRLSIHITILNIHIYEHTVEKNHVRSGNFDAFLAKKFFVVRFSINLTHVRSEKH